MKKRDLWHAFYATSILIMLAWFLCVINAQSDMQGMWVVVGGMYMVGLEFALWVVTMIIERLFDK